MAGPRRIGALAATAGLTVLLVACGSSGGGKPRAGSAPARPSASAPVTASDPLTVLAASTKRTLAAKNATVALTGSVAAAGQKTDLTGSGVVDFSTGNSSSILTAPQLGQVEARVIDRIAYFKVPPAQSAEFGGKPWLKLDPRALGAGRNPLGGLQNSDPGQLMQLLKGAGTVTKAGDETIDGAHTVRYHADIDLIKAADQQGFTPEAKQQLQAAFGGQRLPEDVWIDDQGQVRRVSVEFKTNPHGGASAAPTSGNVQADFSKFGQTDTSGIAAPPSDQVTDLSALLGQLGQATQPSGSPTPA